MCGDGGGRAGRYLRAAHSHWSEQVGDLELQATRRRVSALSRRSCGVRGGGRGRTGRCERGAGGREPEEARRRADRAARRDGAGGLGGRGAAGARRGRLGGKGTRLLEGREGDAVAVGDVNGGEAAARAAREAGHEGVVELHPDGAEVKGRPALLWEAEGGQGSGVGCGLPLAVAGGGPGARAGPGAGGAASAGRIVAGLVFRRRLGAAAAEEGPRRGQGPQVEQPGMQNELERPDRGERRALQSAAERVARLQRLLGPGGAGHEGARDGGRRFVPRDAPAPTRGASSGGTRTTAVE